MEGSGEDVPLPKCNDCSLLFFRVGLKRIGPLAQTVSTGNGMAPNESRARAPQLSDLKAPEVTLSPPQTA